MLHMAEPTRGMCLPMRKSLYWITIGMMVAAFWPFCTVSAEAPPPSYDDALRAKYPKCAPYSGNDLDRCIRDEKEEGETRHLEWEAKKARIEGSTRKCKSEPTGLGGYSVKCTNTGY